MTAGQTVCLSMIVRNEAPVVARCLASVRPVIGAWVVVDTGSTDGTQAVVRSALAGLPGTLVERPWRDFAHNRTEALDLARAFGTYSLVIDADDELVLPAGFRLPPLKADAYTVDIADGSTTYRRTQLVRSALPWRYLGVLHEYVACDAAGPPSHLPLTLRRNHDGARRRDPSTYRKDAAVLEQALAREADPFLVARYTFYLAQSYRDCGEPALAVAHYLRRADLGFWRDEVYVSLTTAARLMAEARAPDETVAATFRRAVSSDPGRAEARFWASQFFRSRGRFDEAVGLTEGSLSLEPPGGGLFVEPWIYVRGLRDEFAVGCYWTGRYRDSLEACLHLLSRPDLPQGDRERIAANARFALDRLSGRAHRGP